MLTNVIEIPAFDFDLTMTLNSGQVFHWEKIGRGFVGTIGDRAVYVEQRGSVLKACTSTAKLDCLKQSSFRWVVANYFALDHPLATICASFPDDPVMNVARDFCRGLRIIRQPKWECLATFICSSVKQVAHIRQISKALRKRFGGTGKIEPPSPRFRRGKSNAEIDNDVRVHTFPTAQRLAGCCEEELRDCALGYRAKNLLATARLVADGDVNLERMTTLSDANLRKALCGLPGVGAKIANCVTLFAYERLRAFPIDVWIERVLRQQYFAHTRKLNALKLREFSESYFGEHSGYAQQYLFHHARAASRGTKVQI